MLDEREVHLYAIIPSLHVSLPTLLFMCKNYWSISRRLCIKWIALYVQGRVIPCDFIGIIKSQQSVYLKGNMDSIT